MGLGAEYDARDALGLAEWIASGAVSAREVLEEALSRAAAAQPHLNAFVNLRPEIARAMVANGAPDGPFGGVPFLLKDLGIEAVDFPCDNGSKLLEGTIHSGDCTLYARLKAAGLVTFGRTTSPEGGVGPITDAAIYGGPTRNPWALNRTPGGSSGGAAAAVAAGVLPAAHGSDGGGSVRMPASSCGLFGMKPTRARLPEGPYSGEGWAGMAIDGFLTRSVRDTAALLDATAGADLGAPYVAPPLRESFMAAIARDPEPLRIGFLTTTLSGAPIHPECARAVDDAAALLASLGHHVEPTILDADVGAMMRAWTVIVACGTALGVRRRLLKLGRALRPGEVEPATEAAMRYAAGLGGADYLAAVETVHAFGREMACALSRMDILLTATLGEPPAEIGRFNHRDVSDFEEYRIGADGVFPYSPFTAAFNASGQPAASVPLHWSDDDLPVGVHIAAPYGEDERVIALAAQLERARPWFHRRPPPLPS